MEKEVVFIIGFFSTVGLAIILFAVWGMMIDWRRTRPERGDKT